MGNSDHTDVFGSSSYHTQLTFHSGLCGFCRWDWAEGLPIGFLPWSPGTISENRSTTPNSLQPQGLYAPWNSPGQNTGVGNLSLLQEIFPTQGSNPGLPHCRWILYQLSYKNIGVGGLSLLQVIFLTQGLNWGLLHCGGILYQLSYQGGPGTACMKIISDFRKLYSSQGWDAVTQLSFISVFCF